MNKFFASVLSTLRVVAPARGEIHPADFVYQFIAQQPFCQGDEKHARFVYFKTGKESAQHLREIVDSYIGDRQFSLLEFASGYGCVTRHFRRVIPAAEVIACDIHLEAVRFVRKFAMDAILSSSIPEELPIYNKFDVVFALSFFSHMPSQTWTRWLCLGQTRVQWRHSDFYDAWPRKYSKIHSIRYIGWWILVCFTNRTA